MAKVLSAAHWRTFSWFMFKASAVRHLKFMMDIP